MIYLTSVNENRINCDADVLDDLLMKISDKDTSALAEVYEKTKASVYSYALSLLKNTHDAEDVLQDCYIKLYSAASGYQSQGKPLAWIMTIARNLCMMKLRERKKTEDIPQEDWEPYLHSCAGLSVEDRLVLEQLMSQLTDEERQIIILHAVTGLKFREIASMLTFPLPTVLSKYNRAIKKLKQHL